MFKVLPVRSLTNLTNLSRLLTPHHGSCSNLLSLNSKYNLNPTTYRHASNNSGYLYIYSFISECKLTELAKDNIVFIHDCTGLPWWGSIIATTLLFRTIITLPLAIYQNYILAKVENLSTLEMPEVAKEVKKETALKAKQLQWSEKQAYVAYKMSMKKRWDALIEKENCHPLKATATVWFQLPAWIFFSAALRNMAYMLPIKDGAAQVIQLQLSVGGFLWIPNLVQPDGLLIFPIILGLSNLAIIEMQVLRRIKEPTRFHRYTTNFFRAFSIALIPISATVPSVVCLYWTTSSLIGLSQNLLMMSNKFRFMCRIPDTPSTFEHPYRQLASDIKIKTKKVTKVFSNK